MTVILKHSSPVLNCLFFGGVFLTRPHQCSSLCAVKLSCFWNGWMKDWSGRVTKQKALQPEISTWKISTIYLFIFIFWGLTSQFNLIYKAQNHDVKPQRRGKLELWCSLCATVQLFRFKYLILSDCAYALVKYRHNKHLIRVRDTYRFCQQNNAADGPTSRPKYRVFVASDTAGNYADFTLKIFSGVMLTNVARPWPLIKNIQ